MDIFQKCFDYADWKRRQLEQIGFYPYFAAIEENRGGRVVIDGRELIMIGSNNYLGLSLDPRVKEAAKKAIDDFGTSCSGSRYLNGTYNLHEELEEDLARFLKKESAVCFTTGYQTNLGGISAILAKGDHVFTDRLNHASVMDGLFLAAGMPKGAGVNIHRYAHNNPVNLEKALAAVPKDAPKLIVTDGVFSMEGDIVKLPELRRLADEYDARLYLDEAHAIGVIGATGRGTEEWYGGKALADLVMCTFSKSFGSVGGFIAGEAPIVDYIKHNARPLIFSASMSPPAIASVSAALKIIEAEPERVQHLQDTAQHMIREFKTLGFDIGVAETPVIPLVIGEDHATFRFWHALFEAGVYANPVVSPAVAPGQALIRTSYMAIHTQDDMDQVLEVTAREARKLGLI